MVFFSDWIPKKHRMDTKHCVLYKKHGGMHSTHNTGECHKYEKDGTPKKSFAGKSAQHNTCSGRVPCEQNNSYAQLSVEIVKLEKSDKMLKSMNKKCKLANTKHKHDHDSDRNDSNSS